MFGYSEIADYIASERPHLIYVRSSSYPIIASALANINDRSKWEDNEQEVTDEQWDDIDEWISGAAYDMAETDYIGTLYWTVRETLPIYVLALDGTTYDKDDFPSLYAVLPSAWKTATQFTLPDWRNRFPVLAGDIYSPYDTGGEATHTLSTSEMPIHSHTYTPPTLNIDLESPGAPDVFAAGVGLPTATGNAGGGAAHENRPPYVALNVGVVAW